MTDNVNALAPNVNIFITVILAIILAKWSVWLVLNAFSCNGNKSTDDDKETKTQITDMLRKIEETKPLTKARNTRNTRKKRT